MAYSDHDPRRNYALFHIRSRNVASTTAQVEGEPHRRTGRENETRASDVTPEDQVRAPSVLKHFMITQRTDPFVSLAVIPEFAYRKVLTSGKWDYDRVIIVGPRTRDGTAGYHVIVPLTRPNGTTVLVDRGFVSKNAFEKFSKVTRTDEEAFVQGMLRVSQVRNAFTPDNHPEKGEWYWIDVGAMAEHVGGAKANVQPVLVEEIFGTRSAWCTGARHLHTHRGSRRGSSRQIKGWNTRREISGRRDAQFSYVLRGNMVSE